METVSAASPAQSAASAQPPPQTQRSSTSSLHQHRIMPEGRKKKRKPGPRVRITEEKFKPRIWMWCVMILLLLQLIGFCTCQPPSGGWYYKQHLIDYLYITVGPFCWQMLSSLWSCLCYCLRVTTHQAFRMVLECWTWSQERYTRVNLQSCKSHIMYSLRYSFFNYLLPIYNGGSCAIALLRAWDLRAILPFVIAFGILAFWKRSELKGQLARVKITLKISINKIRLQNTLSSLVTRIAFVMTVLFLALVYWFKVVDREAFWEWTDGIR